MRGYFDTRLGNSPFFVGKVEDNKDDTFNYRIKVRIPNLHPDSINIENLPWAARVDSTFLGIGNEQDLKHCVPEVGTYVLLLAMNNDPNSLLYLGNLYKNTAQTPSGDEYLGNYGVYRKDGQFIGVDKINSVFKMLFDGDIEVDKVNNISITAKKNITIKCDNATIEASSKVTINTPETDITGNVHIKGNTKIDGTMHSPNYDAHGHPYSHWGLAAGADITSAPNQ